MTDHPMLFSTPMVKALLEGRKTQTRRALKPQPYPLDGRPGFWNASGAVGGRICISDRALLDLHHKPRIGDRLWVREAFRGSKGYDNYPPRTWSHWPVHYEADGDPDPHDEMEENGKLRPGIHMPRWASRITLKVTDVRIERLKDISGKDAIAEGADISPDHSSQITGGPMVKVGPGTYMSPIAWYHRLWNDISGAGAWDANPWVVAYTFLPILANIDEVKN